MTPSPSPALPKLKDLPAARVEAARAAARRTAARLDLEGHNAPYRFQMAAGRPLDDRPVLHIEDLSSIPFLDGVPGVELYQHRARVRAGPDELFAAVCPPVEGYSAYCERIGLGKAVFVRAEPTEDPLEVARACAQGSAFRDLVRHADACGGLVVHPYMANEPVWELAAAIRHESANPVTVIGPPPPVMWVANDKAAFSRLVADAVGEDHLVATALADTAEAAAEHLWAFSRRYEAVGLKRARCASAMGNRVLDGPALRRAGEAGARAEVEDFLAETRWDGEEELLVVEWLRGARSPSTQLWIPPADQGDPVVEGVYEQILESVRGVFVGSRPSTLGPEVDRALVEPSLLVGAAFQTLGYVGRCSFDLLLDESGDELSVRFTECNGRWGGTSTPMHLVDRLLHGGPRPAYRAQDFMHEGLVGARFAEVEAALDGSLCTRDNPAGRFVLYNVGPLESSGKLDVIAIGDSPEHADELMLEALPKRLGLM